MYNKMKHMRIAKLHKQESGLVSIVVTTIIMLVLTLVVIGFARLSQREQRQALDRQISTQAFYAAETAVNDARDKLKTASAAVLGDEYMDDCDEFSTAVGLTGQRVIDAAAGVSYSCLMVDPSPTSLEFANVAVGQ